MSEKNPPHIVVFHLARKANSIVAFENFVASYLRNKAGIQHSLVLIYKGFKNIEETLPYEELVGNLPHQSLLVKDRGYDLSAYFTAAAIVEAELVCFLNSFSVIESGDWLLKLAKAMETPGVGLVGATGSWGTRASGLSRKRKTLWEKLGGDGLSLYKKIWDKVIYGLFFKDAFSAFPNPHIRSNAFLIKRSDFLSLRRSVLWLKAKNYFFESGNDSMTNQILQKNKKVLIIGANGFEYLPEQWAHSRTFWIEKQENLMVSDNQTDNYTKADTAEKDYLRKFAWGK